jgi:hypothetical protein
VRRILTRTRAGFRADAMKKFMKLGPLWIAYVINALYSLQYYPKFNFVSLFDTASYMQAGSRILSGQVDRLRTPAYPLFLMLCSFLSGGEGDKMRLFAGIIQIAVFFISMYFFYRIAEHFIENAFLQCFAVVVYGCASIIINYHVMLLTESFSISGIVIFAFLLIRYVETNRPLFIIWASAAAWIITMIRPSGLFLFVAAALLMAGVCVNRRTAPPKSALIAFMLSVALIFGYMGLNLWQNKYFGLSSVSDINQFYDVAIAGICKDNSDQEIAKALQEQIDGGLSPLGAAIETERNFASYDRSIESDHSIRKPFGAISRNLSGFYG